MYNGAKVVLPHRSYTNMESGRLKRLAGILLLLLTLECFVGMFDRNIVCKKSIFSSYDPDFRTNDFKINRILFLQYAITHP